MVSTRKIWGFVAASVVTVPGVIGERPQSGDRAALEEDRGKVNSNRAANICCLKSIQTEKNEFSEKGESEFPYTASYKTKYTFYENLITAKMINDEDFNPERDCDMTALLGDVPIAQARTKCQEKIKSLPAYWKKIGEWDNENRKLLDQDAEAHLQYTIKEQQVVVKTNNEEHKNEFNADKTATEKSITEAIKSSQVDYIAIIEKMKQKLTELQNGISGDLQQVQEAVKFELDKTQGLVHPSMDQRLSHLMEVSQSFNLKTGSPEQAQVFPHHDESAFKVTDTSRADAAYAAIKSKVQNVMDNLISESQLPDIQSGVDALNPRVFDELDVFLSRSDASMTAQEQKLNAEQAKWVDTVNKAKAMITNMDSNIGTIEATEQAKQMEVTAKYPGQATSRATSNCAFPEGQDKLDLMDYCCCKMKPEGFSEGRWGLVPRKFEDWASCEETKKMTKDAGNYALQAVTLGQMDTGSCNYYAHCPSCEMLDADGKVLFDPRKKRASLQMNEHADLLAKYNLEFSRVANDKKHLYAKCPGSDEEYKVSLDVNECNTDAACLALDPPGYGFLVEDKCCAASAIACSCGVTSLFGGKSCRCKYTGPLPTCPPAP